VIGTQQSAEWNRWFRRWKERAAKPELRVFCFPYAGGSANAFRAWSAAAPATVELIAVQYPGHADRIAEACMESIDGMSAAIASAYEQDEEVAAAFFGHSLGAVVAYEVARRLEAQGRPPVALIVSGRPAPQLDRGGAVHLLDEAGIFADMVRLGGTTPELLDHTELRALLLPMLRSDYRLSETYRPVLEPKLRLPVMACFSERDPEVTESEARGWAAVTEGPFVLRAFGGDHFYLTAAYAHVVEAIVSFSNPKSPFSSSRGRTEP
jgi:pyochelin biosynthetic protein PchC